MTQNKLLEAMLETLKKGYCPSCGNEVLSAGSNDLYKAIYSCTCGLLLCVPGSHQRCEHCATTMCKEAHHRYCEECNKLIVCVKASNCSEKECLHRIAHEPKQCDRTVGCPQHPLDKDVKCVPLYSKLRELNETGKNIDR